MSKVKKHNTVEEEDIKDRKLDLDKFFNSYTYDQDRIVTILGMKKDDVLTLKNLGFVFDYNTFVFKSLYDFKVSDGITKTFNVVIGKSNEGYYLNFSNDEVGGKDFITHPDFNNYINPLNLLFQLKSFIETDKIYSLYFLLLEDINNCIKNKSGFIEIQNSKISPDSYSTYPVAINAHEIWYHTYTDDKKKLEGRRGYGYNTEYYSDKYFSPDDKDLITTPEGYYVYWKGKKFVSQLNEAQLNILREILTEPLELAKSKKTFKKFVAEENKI